MQARWVYLPWYTRFQFGLRPGAVCDTWLLSGRLVRHGSLRLLMREKGLSGHHVMLLLLLLPRVLRVRGRLHLILRVAVYLLHLRRSLGVHTPMLLMALR